MLLASVVFAPGYVNMLGHQYVFMSGPCYTNTSNITCTFFDPNIPSPISVPGIALDPRTATCITPTLFSQGRLDVELKIADVNKTVRYMGILTVCMKHEMLQR